MALTFYAIADAADGAHGGGWQRMAALLLPAYRRWYASEGLAARPSLADCRRALETHLPEMVPEWERLTALVGGGELDARLLSLYRPPAYLAGCSQAVWPGPEPLLVRNYDYSSAGFDAVCLHTRWAGRPVMGTSDCLVGLVDGINDAGLAVSLTFGGSREVGPGFGVPIILRHVLQTCTSTEQAAAVLARVPCHMAYNVTVVDARRTVRTAMLGPGREAVLTASPVATNHQAGRPRGPQSRLSATVERERYLLRRLMLHEDSPAHFVDAFLRPPLYSTAYHRGFGTLYTAAYRPQQGTVSYHWPSTEWTLALDDFRSGQRTVADPQ
jgi:predicted choloylglycine hydrolase